MASRKTWLWIILGGLGFCVLVLFVIAGVGVYFVASHIDTSSVTSAEVVRVFDDARARFKDQKPLFELDDRERPHVTRELSSMPRAERRTENLAILVWDPDEERTVRITLPFWILRLGNQKIELGHRGFDIERLNLDLDELQRVGPLLVFDYRATSGERVLIWTQ